MEGKGKTAPHAVGCLLILYITSVVSIPIASSEPTEGELATIVERAQLGTVLVQTLDWRGNVIGGGTGFFVNEYGGVVTASHVVRNPKRTVVRTIFGEIYPIDGVLAEDIGRDVILLSTPVPHQTLHPLPLASSLPEPGERVVLVPSADRQMRTGIFEAAPKIPEEERLMVITVSIEPGWSGSPVVNTEGEVVGIVIRRAGGLKLATPVTEVTALLSGKRHSFFSWESDASGPPNDSPEDLYWAGKLVKILRCREDGLPYFEQAFEKDPEYAEAYVEAAFCYRKSGRYYDAMNAFRHAVRIKPSDPSLHYGLGFVCYLLNRYDDAIKSYKQAIQIDPEDAQKHCSLGDVYSSMRQYNEAVACYEEAIRLDPKYADVYVSLGLLHRVFSRYEEANETYKKQLRVNPTDGRAYGDLAYTYDRLGRYREAIQAYKEGIRLDPGNTHFHYRLALDYMGEVDIWSALGEYQILKDLDQDKAKELFDSICGWFTDH